MKPLVSVVVTTSHGSIENAERCLNSIINQNLKNIEILVIDDGYSLEEEAILQNLCDRDPRIRFIHRGIKGGLNASRNTGIRCANGEYITFVDFDDYLNDMFCWILSDYMNDTGAEISICGVMRETNTDVPSIGMYHVPQEIIDSDEHILELGVCTINDGMPESAFHIEGLSMVGAKMYRKAFLNDCPWVLFPDESTEGDGVVFLLRALSAQPIVYLADVPLYVLTSASEGFTPSNDPKFVEHERNRLQAINSETMHDPQLSRATAREALCSLLNIEKNLKKTKGRDNKLYIKSVLEMEEYSDALVVFKQLGFSSNDQYLLQLSKQKKVSSIIKEVL